MRCFLTFVAVTLVGFSTHSSSMGWKESPPTQWRAFWVDAFNIGFKTPGQVDQLIADLKSMHFNTVIAQVRKRGDAYYRKTTVTPFTQDPEVPADFDPLTDLIEKAHAAKIQVHAWINPMPVWKPDEAPPKDPAHLFHTHGEAKTGRDNWLTCDENGNAKYGIGYFLDAGHPDVPNHLVQVVSDIVKNYAVDGIHLDYIRYPTPDSGTDETGYGVGYNSVSVERFNRAHKRTGKPAKNDPAWCDWRRTQVTELVRRFRMHLLELKPSVMLSAALIPWGDGPLSEEAWTKTAPYNRVFQNWHEWRKEGLLDIIVPMNYDRDHLPQQKAFFDHWIDFERKHPYRSKVIVGVGAYLNTVPNTESQIRRALTARDGMPAADGICLFSYAALRKAQPGSDKPTLSELQKALVTASTQPGTEPLFAKPFVAPVVTRAMK